MRLLDEPLPVRQEPFNTLVDEEPTQLWSREDDERPTDVGQFLEGPPSTQGAASVPPASTQLGPPVTPGAALVPPAPTPLGASVEPFEDPHDGLESLPPMEPGAAGSPVLTPSVVPAGSGGLAWDDERPAAAHLSEQNVRGDWLARAEWMENEAETTRDPQARARMLVVASELWAMSGDLGRARAAAQSANSAAPAGALVGRQLRWLAAAERDFKSVAAALELETRASATSDARVHAACLNAEINRVVLEDPAAAQKKWQLAGRILMPSDPRPAVMKLGEALIGPGKPTDLKLPDMPELTPLAEAAAELAQMRVAEPATEEATATPHTAFQAARRALANADTVGAAEALGSLSTVPGLRRATLWLQASLLAREAGTRDRSISLLEELLGSDRTPSAVRALVFRALEQGDLASVHAALAAPDSTDAFEPADRVALGALAGGNLESVRPSLDSLATNDSLRPLATASLSASLRPTEPLETMAGSDASRSEVALGRALADTRTAPLEAAFTSFMEAHPETPLGPALALELSVLQQDGPSVATELRQLGLGQDPSRDAERDHLLAAALAYEATGSGEEASRAYALASASDPAHEAATRAALFAEDATAASALLVALSEHVYDDTHRALLLLEAAIRRGPEDNPEYAGWLEQAVRAAPDLPFAYRMGEELARIQAEPAALVGWIRQRRETAADPVDGALDLAREALLVADTDIDRARALVGEATEARPGDVALHELHERLSPGAGADKGAWREALSTTTKGGKLPLLLAAAVEYERAGDTEAAARSALAAADLGDSEFAAVLAERLGATGTGAARLSERLFARARAEDDPVVQRELYERLSRIDGVRGDQASSLLWQNAILERTPGYLPALRRLEHGYIGAARDAELEPVAASLAVRLEGPEAVAHAALATRLRTRLRGWQEARELVAMAGRQPNRSLWTLRQLAAHARFAGDDNELVAVYEELADRVTHALDVATLALRAAEAAVRLGKIDRAKSLLERSVDIVPNHLIALTTQAEVLESSGDFEGAAEAFEASAQVSNVEPHKLDAWQQAATLWLDKLNNRQRGLIALERAADIDITHEDVFARLQALYVAEQDRPRLADLLQRRLDRTTDARERVALEVTRGKALAEVGDRTAARAALAAALEAEPEQLDALAALAELCATDSDWEGAEQAWLRLAGHAPTAERQAIIYQNLAELYDTKLDKPERAELSYLEVLKRQPDDTTTTEKLVRVYTRLGNAERALELQNGLLERATSPEEKCRLTLGLALVHEQAAHDVKQAESMLEKARKAWPGDAHVLRGTAEFMRRQGDQRGLGLLLDRSTADARRALNTGRFEPHLFDVLSTVAELKGATDAARVAKTTLFALEGKPSELAGIGDAAARPDLDDLLAPEPLGLPMRVLLHELGGALDVAFPADLRSLRVGPWPEEAAEFGSRVAELGAAFELGPIEAFVSPALGPVCLPASAAPPCLVFGQKLLEQAEDPATLFLVVRALKILATRASALSRSAPIDLWPMAAGLLACLVPSWQPQAVDMKRFEEAKSRLHGRLPSALGPELDAAALEVTSTIGNRGTQLGTAVNQWGNRVALLALGDPSVALRAVAVGLGTSAALPPGGPDRIKWIMRHPEARDLAIFSVSDHYVEARKRAGIEDP